MGLFLVGVAVWLARVENWRAYTSIGGTVGGESAHVSREKPSGLVRWLTTVDHKDIGMLYGTYAVTAFVVGGLMVMLMRVELADPKMTLLSNTFYNSLLTSHGITMLFLFGTPIIAAFA
ncbi:MAG: cbb3-type cytochrome c oxidase subunit I, partial [Haloferacaceae archaeon]